jgi:hypothetical protein
MAKEAVIKSGNYAFRDRRAKKRDFRKLANNDATDFATLVETAKNAL